MRHRGAGGPAHPRHGALAGLARALDERTDDPEQLGFGRHILERYQLPPWRSMVTDESAAQAFERNVPYLAHGTPGGIDALREVAGEEVGPLLDTIEPAPVPALWAFEMDIVRDGGGAGRAWCYSARLHDDAGELFGIARMYTAGLPARLLAMVARGDELLFERMAQVAEPRARATAVLFADLDSSGVLSRRLAGAAYFRLIAALGADIDAAVIEREGIVGKHAGDGATAFFLAEQLGSESAAAKAALQTACELPDVVARAVDRLREERLPIDAAACRLNVGVHWGASLFIGQLTTSGRLEVTALGDEVNECARIEQSARGRRPPFPGIAKDRVRMAVGSCGRTAHLLGPAGKRGQRVAHARRKDRVDLGGVAGAASGKLVAEDEDRREHGARLVVDPHAVPAGRVAAVELGESGYCRVEPAAVGSSAAAEFGESVEGLVHEARGSSRDRSMIAGRRRLGAVVRAAACRRERRDRDGDRRQRGGAGQLRLRGRHVRPPSLDQSTAPSGRAT